MKSVTVKAILALFLLTISISPVTAAEPAEPGLAALALSGERFVPMAPCRLIDTRSAPAKTPADELSRNLKMAETHCGGIVPPYAAAYAVRVMTLDKHGPEQGPVTGVVAPAARMITDLAGTLRFTVSPARHLAVDLEGYYVPPGIPIDARGTTAASTPAGPPPFHTIRHSGSPG